MTRTRRLLAWIVVAGSLGALLCTAPPQVAADAMIQPASRSASDTPALQAQSVGSAGTTTRQPRWLLQGRFCTPHGCHSRSADPRSSALGFAVAATGAAWLSRRRGDTSPGR